MMMPLRTLHPWLLLHRTWAASPGSQWFQSASISTSPRYLTPLTASGKPDLFVFLPLLQKPSVALALTELGGHQFLYVFSASAGVGGLFFFLWIQMRMVMSATWDSSVSSLCRVIQPRKLFKISCTYWVSYASKSGVTLLVAWHVYSPNPVLLPLFSLQLPDKWYPLSLSSDVFSVRVFFHPPDKTTTFPFELFPIPQTLVVIPTLLYHLPLAFWGQGHGPFCTPIGST